MQKLHRDLENNISIHGSIFYYIFGQQKVKTPVYEIALSIFLTIFYVTFIMMTARDELLFARTFA